MARTGAKKLEFTEFNEIMTFGAKMSPKVTFSDFRSPKVTFRAQAHGCACSQWFLGVFYGPGELKCNFSIQNQLFVTFSTFARKSHFLRKSNFFSEKVTFELPGLEKVAIFHWFLKGPERSAPSATFDDTKTVLVLPIFYGFGRYSAEVEEF